MSTKKADKEERSTIIVRVPKEMAEQLKWLSFKMKVSIAELCRRGAEKIIKENYKKFPPP